MPYNNITIEQRLAISKRSTVHGHSYGTRTYNAWGAINCGNRDSENVHEEWRSDFSQFLKDMGECPPGMVLGRIDRGSGFNPKNCEWITRQESNRRRKNNRIVSIYGHDRSVAEWSELTGICKNTILGRLRRGFTGYDILKPIHVPAEKKPRMVRPKAPIITARFKAEIKRKGPPSKIERIVSKGDYMYAVVYGHPMATKNHYVLVHRVVMENHIGRFLRKEEVVHHKDENKKNNAIENLELVASASEHVKIHSLSKTRLVAVFRCPCCGKVFEKRPGQSVLCKARKCKHSFCSKRCSALCRNKKSINLDTVQNFIEFKKYVGPIA